jgi:chromate reductase
MTNEYRVALVVGSLRRESLNRQLARALQELAPAELVFHELAIGDLPLFDQDEEQKPGEPVKRLKREIAAADALLFVTPEYNRSIPGVLKNGLDYASRPYGQNAWAGKPAGVIGASVGAAGTSMAQQHLRNVLAYLDVPTLGQPEAFIHVREGFFDESGAVAQKDSREFLHGWITAYAAFVAKHAAQGLASPAAEVAT